MSSGRFQVEAEYPRSSVLGAQSLPGSYPRE
jgi:hypothetical protein